jgi:hypothetical protein
MGLLREEGCGFFQDFPLFPQYAVLTAEAAKLGALFGHQATGAPAGIKIGLLDPVPE